MQQSGYDLNLYPVGSIKTKLITKVLFLKTKVEDLTTKKHFSTLSSVDASHCHQTQITLQVRNMLMSVELVTRLYYQ